MIQDPLKNVYILKIQASHSSTNITYSKPLTVIIDVPPKVNEAPRFKSPPHNAKFFLGSGANKFIYYFQSFFDPEGTKVTLSFTSSLPSFVKFDSVKNKLTLEPTQAGTFNFVVRLMDEDKRINLFSFEIEIADVAAQEVVDETKTIIEIE